MRYWQAHRRSLHLIGSPAPSPGSLRCTSKFLRAAGSTGEGDDDRGRQAGLLPRVQPPARRRRPEPIPAPGLRDPEDRADGARVSAPHAGLCMVRQPDAGAGARRRADGAVRPAAASDGDRGVRGVSDVEANYRGDVRRLLRREDLAGLDREPRAGHLRSARRAGGRGRPGSEEGASRPRGRDRLVSAGANALGCGSWPARNSRASR